MSISNFGQPSLKIAFNPSLCKSGRRSAALDAIISAHFLRLRTIGSAVLMGLTAAELFCVAGGATNGSYLSDFDHS